MHAPPGMGRRSLRNEFMDIEAKWDSPTLDRMYFAAWYFEESNLENFVRNFLASERKSSLLLDGPRDTWLCALSRGLPLWVVGGAGTSLEGGGLMISERLPMREGSPPCRDLEICGTRDPGRACCHKSDTRGATVWERGGVTAVEFPLDWGDGLDDGLRDGLRDELSRPCP